MRSACSSCSPPSKELQGEQHRLGLQNGPLGTIDAKPQPPPAGGEPVSAGLAGLSGRGQCPAGDGHCAAGPAAWRGGAAGVRNIRAN